MKKILITSIGRTGTVSLAHFLNEIPGVICFHEKERLDVSYLFLSQLKQYSNITNGYLENRDRELESLNCDIYIEVNPYLRFADDAFLKELGWQKIYLVRHPKTYLESVYTRNLFTKNDYVLNQYPQNEDEFSKNWYFQTRFQKLCWYYSKVHNHIISSKSNYYRFEELITDSEKLKEFVGSIGVETNNIKSFILPKLNSSFRNKIRQKIIATAKGNKMLIEPLDWDKLSKAELETYHSSCKTFEKLLGYVL